MDGASSLCQTAAGQPHPSVLSAAPRVLVSCLSPLNSLFLALISSKSSFPLSPQSRSFSFSLKYSLPVFSFSLPLPSPVLHLLAVWARGGWRRAVAVWRPKVHRRQHGQTLAMLKRPSLNTSFCTKATMQKVTFNNNSTKPLEHFYVETCVRLSEGLRSLSNPLFMGPQLETDFYHPCSIACFYCATLADLHPSAYLDLRKLLQLPFENGAFPVL